MKAFLMYRDQDFDLQHGLPWNEEALVQDLELNTLFAAMAQDDEFLAKVAKIALLSGLNLDRNTILYRQEILKDCLKNPAIVRQLYALTLEAIEGERKFYFGLYSKSPSLTLRRSLELLQFFVTMLKRLRKQADQRASQFQSEGFTTLFTMLQEELSDDYFAIVETHLETLKFGRGALISAGLGKGNKGVHYTLRKPHEDNRSWLARLFGDGKLSYTYRIADRDDAGARALSDLKDKGLNLVANALKQSCDHILSFFTMFRNELAFYVGCLNLHQELTQIGEPITYPVPEPRDQHRHAFRELYDASLALTVKQKIVGNALMGDEKDLVIITGANQGGKSTFLRSVGLAQLMMQCGMFVAASSFRANLCDALFTHYKREEDTTMESGKLDEELSRMSDIVDNVTPYSMVLFNESFAATNEVEGAEIARQIITALLEERIKVFFVTHLYESARGFYERDMDSAIFLRAERRTDGKRTYKLIEAEPLETSYGQDLYQKIFLNGN